ncbi:MAG TPA: SMC-Scp complex subunit ScpB [Candidatus Binataceae bacterium]|nr:SMC-Scp complex subunit ScpB [Candidatus Binataceae bacterium]
MEEERLKAILESLLFAAGEPVPLARLAAVLDNVARDAIKKALGEMLLGYGGGGRGVVLEEVAGGYQLRTPKEHALYVRKLLAAKPPRLSRPLLETLAIIAYRQPVTRPEIEQLRGVDSGGVLETLLERRLVRIAGRKEAPGRPIMYATSAEFLEVFGLRDLDGLPDLEEFKELDERAAQEASEMSAAGVEVSPAAAGATSTPAEATGAEESSGGDTPPEPSPGGEAAAPLRGAAAGDTPGSDDDTPGASPPDPALGRAREDESH